jgi:hypothetical protein
MSTLGSLVETGALLRVEAPLRPKQLPMRRLYGTRRFNNWLNAEVPMITATMWGGDMSAAQQAAVLLADFIAGEPFDYPTRIKYLKPATSGVWELKSGDLRIFEWFPEHDCFIAANGADAYDVKQSGGYASMIHRAVECRDRLDLDEPKFIRSTELRHVISG